MATKPESKETETESHPMADEARVRQLTEKATDIYDEKVKHYTVELSILWDRVDFVIQSIDENKDNLNVLLDVERKLIHNVENFDKFSSEFSEYLKRTRTEESLSESNRLDFLRKGYNLLIENAKRRLLNITEEHNKKDNKSETSYYSRTSSTRTSQSSILARKAAKAEAAKVSLQFS